MSNKIIAENREHLEQIIFDAIDSNGEDADLNHIDVSNITDMSYLFWRMPFNGNISNWDVSNVKDMANMFQESQFNGDISGWNISKVTYMDAMFQDSVFNGDISKWNVASLTSMIDMFRNANFEGDINSWQPYNLERSLHAFLCSNTPVPHWEQYENKEERNAAIKSYLLQKKLNETLEVNLIVKNKNKL
jgi:surface protein